MFVKHLMLVRFAPNTGDDCLYVHRDLMWSVAVISDLQRKIK